MTSFKVRCQLNIFRQKCLWFLVFPLCFVRLCVKYWNAGMRWMQWSLVRDTAPHPQNSPALIRLQASETHNSSQVTLHASLKLQSTTTTIKTPIHMNECWARLHFWGRNRNKHFNLGKKKLNISYTVEKILKMKPAWMKMCPVSRNWICIWLLHTL